MVDGLGQMPIKARLLRALSVPILLEIGIEPVGRVAREDILRDAAAELIADATRTGTGEST